MDTENTVEQTPNETLGFAGRHFNDSAIHTYALKCSKEIKGGKFTRVGQDFIDEVHADVESLIRKWRSEFPVQIHAPVETDGATFTTGALLERAQEALNGAIARLIQRKVQRHPSCGKTLGRTR